MESTQNSLVLFNQAEKMLAEAVTIQETKECKDRGLTLLDWARRKGVGADGIKYIRGYVARAEIKLGEMLLQTDPARGTRTVGGGGPSGGHVMLPPETEPPTIAEMGLSKRESSAAKLLARLPEEMQTKITSGEVSKQSVKKEVKQKEREEKIAEQVRTSLAGQPFVEVSNAVEWLERQETCDLLFTDPPYMTDVQDIAAFAKSWLPLALSKIKSTGRGFVCIGAYPAELIAYLSVSLPSQVLVWTYRNTLGPSPKDMYKQNWQAVLYYKGDLAPPLDCPLMTEQFSVQDISAPDGRQGNKYHAWQKPLELGERLIRHTTRPGNVIYDPFCGTGTFLIAASKLGRVALGCDSDTKIIEIARMRGCRVG